MTDIDTDRIRRNCMSNQEAEAVAAGVDRLRAVVAEPRYTASQIEAAFESLRAGEIFIRDLLAALAAQPATDAQSDEPCDDGCCRNSPCDFALAAGEPQPAVVCGVVDSRDRWVCKEPVGHDGYHRDHDGFFWSEPSAGGSGVPEPAVVACENCGKGMLGHYPNDDAQLCVTCRPDTPSAGGSGVGAPTPAEPSVDFDFEDVFVPQRTPHAYDPIKFCCLNAFDHPVHGGAPTPPHRFTARAGYVDAACTSCGKGKDHPAHFAPTAPEGADHHDCIWRDRWREANQTIEVLRAEMERRLVQREMERGDDHA